MFQFHVHNDDYPNSHRARALTQNYHSYHDNLSKDIDELIPNRTGTTQLAGTQRDAARHIKNLQFYKPLVIWISLPGTRQPPTADNRLQLQLQLIDDLINIQLSHKRHIVLDWDPSNTASTHTLWSTLGTRTTNSTQQRCGIAIWECDLCNKTCQATTCDSFLRQYKSPVATSASADDLWINIFRTAPCAATVRKQLHTGQQEKMYHILL